MKYLSKDIEALSKLQSHKSLVRANTSCGIFQDTDYTKDSGKLYHQIKIEKLKPTKKSH
ncbi:hypothetical protein [Wenyingzhuangia sp. 2_MG-2023]|uniref:hypothetical protein n=1 Tax=Wenyingzhuangia sp. 2_MG-2023 TaxID=3062639 RepID=UPI0026E16E60|nr:hypothetical protein [Wenyingzhuangia sp. 2_MG-2023]MDO6737289.1 hypothetical protein [Wenyingzhuangia sp. 2_MG-2023]MDO6801632.1 hypothetical protein [Wenyingzhuangia sp. 1_MG-2023]